MWVLNLNGPPGCGKDTICEEIKKAVKREDVNVVHMEFKGLLFEIAIRASGLPEDVWYSLYEREFKEKPCDYLLINGVKASPREWMIHCSENLMKPLFGEDVFGKVLVEKLRDIEDNTPEGEKNLVVISDGGFIEETSPVVNFVGEDNYFLYRIKRKKPSGEFYDFKGDSRSYLFSKDFPCATLHEKDILNKEGDIEGTIEDIFEFFSSIKEESLF